MKLHNVLPILVLFTSSFTYGRPTCKRWGMPTGPNAETVYEVCTGAAAVGTFGALATNLHYAGASPEVKAQVAGKVMTALVPTAAAGLVGVAGKIAVKASKSNVAAATWAGTKNLAGSAYNGAKTQLGNLGSGIASLGKGAGTKLGQGANWIKNKVTPATGPILPQAHQMQNLNHPGAATGAPPANHANTVSCNIRRMLFRRGSSSCSAKPATKGKAPANSPASGPKGKEHATASKPVQNKKPSTQKSAQIPKNGGQKKPAALHNQKAAVQKKPTPQKQNKPAAQKKPAPQKQNKSVAQKKPAPQKQNKPSAQKKPAAQSKPAAQKQKPAVKPKPGAPAKPVPNKKHP